MAQNESAQSPLLELPDSCLLAALQCCAAGDQRRLFSAARAHSRLHQAAVAVLHSITVKLTKQRHWNRVLKYLEENGDQINSLNLCTSDSVILQPGAQQPTVHWHAPAAAAW
jgi:hypothetical protein